MSNMIRKNQLFLGTVAPLLIFTLGTLLSLGSGCSTAPIDENDPAALYRDAEADIKSDHYAIALEKLRSVKNKFPYSKFALDAQLRIADVYFLQEDFPEAGASYEAFHDLHPKHEKASYALYRAGKSYFSDSPGTVARDMTPTKKALDIFVTYLKTYPNGPEASDAKEDLAKARNLLADKELYVADFYFRERAYDSAKPRYEKIVELYPETTAASQAKEQLNLIASKSKTVSGTEAVRK